MMMNKGTVLRKITTATAATTRTRTVRKEKKSDRRGNLLVKRADDDGNLGIPLRAPILPTGLGGFPLYITIDLVAGTHIEHDGDVVIVGNVERDASVTCGGDLVVFGSLLGEARTNRRTGKIYAIDMRPEALSIEDEQMEPPEYLLDKDVKDTREFTGVPTCAEIESINNKKTKKKKAIIQLRAFEDTYRRSSSAKKNFTSSSTLSSEQLKRSKKAAHVTGTYILVVGVCLLLFPERLFAIIFPYETLISSVWIRVIATAAIAFGLYYRAVAKNGEAGFYRATVSGRVFVGASLIVLSLSGNYALFLAGFVNILGALAMRNALQFGNNNSNNINSNNSWAKAS